MIHIFARLIFQNGDLLHHQKETDTSGFLKGESSDGATSQEYIVTADNKHNTEVINRRFYPETS